MQQTTVNIFLDSLNSKHTKDMYQFHWLRFQKSNPTRSKNPKLIENNIISYLMQMKAEGLSFSYRNSALAAIKHHFTMVDDLVLNWKKIAKLLGERTFDNELRGYTRGEIARLLSVADVKYRAIILLYASTSMRREALAQITKKDMEYLEEYKLYKIKIYRKTPDEQICYTTPEAAEAINLYLKMHDKKDDAHQELFHFSTLKTISMVLREIAIRAGISQEHHTITENKGEKRGQFRDAIPAVHGLRKFCITQMAKSGIDEERRKILSGHSIGVQKKYVELQDEDLLQDYLKAVNNLTINEEYKLKTENIELKKKNAEIQTLKEQVKELQEKDDEWSKFMKRLQLVEKFLDSAEFERRTKAK
jgi:integrase